MVTRCSCVPIQIQQRFSPECAVPVVHPTFLGSGCVILQGYDLQVNGQCHRFLSLSIRLPPPRERWSL